MTNIQTLLELKKAIKRKKPDFIRQDSHKKKRLGRKWRKPKGLHSKMRVRKRGYRKCVSKGYGSPKEVRHLSNKGVKGIIVYNQNQLEEIKSDKEGIIIGKSVGLKKKIEICKKAKEKGIIVLNIKNVDNYLKQIEEKLRKKQQEKQKSEKEKERKVKKAEEKKEGEKDGLTEKIEIQESTEKIVAKEEEKKKREEEKEEKDKILTKRI
jgi:large subunit ribosomal protein L32e